MKNKKIEDLNNSINKEQDIFSDCGIFGLFFLWYLYRELERQAIIEYLEEQRILNDLDSTQEDTKKLVKMK